MRSFQPLIINVILLYSDHIYTSIYFVSVTIYWIYFEFILFQLQFIGFISNLFCFSYNLFDLFRIYLQNKCDLFPIYYT
jgi:hypothetical protein